MTQCSVASLDDRAKERAQASGFDDEAVIDELAQLTLIEYDRVRKDKAESLGCRTETLDKLVEAARAREDNCLTGKDVVFEDVGPAEDPVDGEMLLDEIAAELRRYMVMPDGAADAVALWVLHAWCHQASRVSPLLAITSPEKRCGKSTLLTLLQHMTPRALSTSNITAAALFRAVEKWSPTLLVDEADTFLGQSDELRGILNSGHTVDNAFVVRTVGEDHEPRSFSTWTPKAVALIGKLPATLSDRSILITLRRRLPEETVERLRLDQLEYSGLRARCARWAYDHLQALRTRDPTLPNTLNDRATDNWRPLAAIAEQAGGDWPGRLRDTIGALIGDEDDEGSRVTLLADIRHILDERGCDRISSDDLVHALVALEDRPWPEWRKGHPLSKTGLAKLLRPFGIHPKGTRIGDHTPRGYKREQFEDAFARYLPPTNATPQQPQRDTGSRHDWSATDNLGVARSDAPKTASQDHCCSVADENAGPSGANGVAGELLEGTAADDQENNTADVKIRRAIGNRHVTADAIRELLSAEDLADLVRGDMDDAALEHMIRKTQAEA